MSFDLPPKLRGAGSRAKRVGDRAYRFGQRVTDKTTSTAPRVWRSPQLKIIGSSVLAGSLVVAVAGAGATTATAASADSSGNSMVDSVLHPQPAETQEPPAQGAAAPFGSGLNVTVGKSVLITTSQGGDPQLRALVSSTQVSGNGQATVKVPMATNKAKNSGGFTGPEMQGQNIVYDVNNSGTKQQNLGAANASYKGQLPIGISVSCTVDGKNVPPQNMVNVTGKVQCNYTFTNQTVEQTPISYKSPTGQVVTETVPIPVPFGGSFVMTVPQGFADVSAPWAQGGLTPVGSVLAGSLFLFPPLGKTTQTLSFQARADHATLPASSLTALPVTLSNNAVASKLFGYTPLANGLTQGLYDAVSPYQSKLLTYQTLLLKYQALAEGVITQYIDPNIANFQKNGKKWLSQIEAGGAAAVTGSKSLGTLLSIYGELSGPAAALIDQYGPLLISKFPVLNKYINSLQSIASAVAAAVAVAGPVLNTISALTKPVINSGLKLANAANTVCPKVQGYITDWTKAGGWKAQLEALAAVLPEPGKTELLNFISYIDGTITSYGTDVDKCVEFAPEAVYVMTVLSQHITEIQDGIAALNALLKTASKALSAGAAAAQVFKALEPKIALIISNTNCPPLAQLNKTNANLKNCGIMQLVDRLNQGTQVAKNLINNTVTPGVEKIVTYLPAFAKYYNLALASSGKVQAGIDGIPAELNKYAGMLGLYSGYVGQATNAIGGAEVTVAKLTATLQIMNARAQAGQGVPAGPAQGATNNLAAYMYNIQAASNANQDNAVRFGLAALLMIIGAGVGTAMYVRRH